MRLLIDCDPYNLSQAYVSLDLPLQGSRQSFKIDDMHESPLQISRAIKPLDLAMLAGRKRQSARTGFVHLFHGSETAADTIPLYENGCFALALLSQRKAEAVLEARQLLLKLLAFQTQGGNFPIYLHDFPRCYDPHLGLKMAPLFLRALNDFGVVLGVECKEKLEASLMRIFSWVEQKKGEHSLSALWQFRFEVCRAVFERRVCKSSALDTSGFSAEDFWEYWVSLQWIETPTCDFYHKGLQMAIGPFLANALQDRFEPMAERIDWICAEESGERLSADRSAQIQLSAIEGVRTLAFNRQIAGYCTDIGDRYALLALQKAGSSSVSLAERKVPIMHFLWRDSPKDALHSACLEAQAFSIASKMEDGSLFIRIDLPASFELQREALFEVAFFVDVLPGIEVLIEGKRGTCFSLADRLFVQSPCLEAEISFALLEGEGDFCGHLFRANRSSQRAAIGDLQYETFDWKVALRTLRRSEQCSIGFRFHSTFYQV